MNLTAQLYFSCRPVTPPRPLTQLLFERFTIKRPGSHWISLSLWPWESITLFCCVCWVCLCFEPVGITGWTGLSLSSLLRCINVAFWPSDGNLNCVFITIFIWMRVACGSRLCVFVCVWTLLAQRLSKICYVFNYAFPVTPFGFEAGHCMESVLFYRITTQATFFLHVNEPKSNVSLWRSNETFH